MNADCLVIENGVLKKCLVNDETVVIPKGVRCIGYGAFEDCCNLINVTIPDSVTCIGTDAFRDCSHLLTVHYEGGETKRIVVGTGNDCLWAARWKPLRGDLCTDDQLLFFYAPYRFLARDRAEKSVLANLDSWQWRYGPSNESDPSFWRKFGGVPVDLVHPSLCVEQKIDPFWTKMRDRRSGKTVLKHAPMMLDVIEELYLWEQGQTVDLLVLTRNYWNNTITGTVFLDVYADDDEASKWIRMLHAFGTSREDRSERDEFLIEDSTLFVYLGDAETVAVPDGVTRIATYTFYEKHNIRQVILSDSVTQIDENAFCRCNSLRTIRVSRGVQQIGVPVTNDCGSIQRILVDAENTAFCNMGSVLCSADKKTLIRAPDGLDALGYSVPDGIERIEKCAFLNCHLMQRVDIPNSVRQIGEYAFIGCTSLQAVFLPDQPINIHEKAFFGCETKLLTKRM